MRRPFKLWCLVLIPTFFFSFFDISQRNFKSTSKKFHSKIHFIITFFSSPKTYYYYGSNYNIYGMFLCILFKWDDFDEFLLILCSAIKYNMSVYEYFCVKYSFVGQYPSVFLWVKNLKHYFPSILRWGLVSFFVFSTLDGHLRTIIRAQKEL